jgi:hypothetical protein
VYAAVAAAEVEACLLDTAALVDVLEVVMAERPVAVVATEPESQCLDFHALPHPLQRQVNEKCKQLQQRTITMFRFN